MNDLSDLVPIIAGKIGLAPSTLLLAAWLFVKAAKFGARVIPNDATGVMGYLRRACTIIAVEPSSVLTVKPDGEKVTISDVTERAIVTQEKRS